MRSIEHLAFGALFGLSVAAPLHAFAVTEQTFPDAPPHCLNVPEEGKNFTTDSCSNTGGALEGKTPDQATPDDHGDVASGIEKGVPDLEGDVPGSDESAALSNGVPDTDSNESTGSRRIMWRQIM
jgi:hypothetical protein